MGRLHDATVGRAFAALYDRVLKATEEAGLREMRRDTLADAQGRTIDIGAGTGANLDLYPDAVTDLVMAEPDRHMAKRLRRKVGDSGRDAVVVEAGAEELPFEDSSFDTVVFTLVLCTIPNPARALEEAARVLGPGGRALFLEHVRSKDPKLARWQDRFAGPWRFFNDGCNCNRDTVSTIESSPLALGDVTDERMPKAPPVVRPVARGNARLPSA
jgi:ubiquinone/menaquinone biosynthesis C-methylase UbiE